MAEPSILGALRDPQFRADTLRNLVDALNGAKRSLTVGSLGAAGDMGSTLANLVRAGAGTAYHEATGRPIPQALEYRDPARDFGTSASLGNFAESQGWLPPQTFSMPEQAGALLGPIAAMKAPDLAQSTLRGLVSALKSEPSRRMVEGYMGGMGMKPQAIVWHASPHEFDAFDSSKIGTGEGAQAYGHGLYTASHKSVATSPETNYMKNERIIARNNGSLSLLQDRISDGIDQGKSVNDIFGEMTKLGLKVDKGGFDTPYDALAHEYAKVQAMNTGHLYKVDLPDPLIARMLDWDKPLSQQPKAAQSFFADVNRAPEKSQALGEWLQPRMREGMAPYWSDDFRKAGIPGIRYLDGGSRADGAGTSNYVIFPNEEGALTILERNGVPISKVK